MVPLAPKKEVEPNPALVRETQWLSWNYPDQDEIEQLRDAQGVDA